MMGLSSKNIIVFTEALTRAHDNDDISPLVFP